MKIVLIGPQGSGKGTQGKILSERLKIPTISMGDLLRNAEGELKDEINKCMNEGILVPLHITDKLIENRLKESDCSDGFILDGYPRNLVQARSLNDISEIDRVVEISLSDEEAVRRLSGRVSCSKCGAIFNVVTNPSVKEGVCDDCGSELFQRDDDKPEAIMKRLEVYKNETEPVIGFYEGDGVEGDGVGSGGDDKAESSNEDSESRPPAREMVLRINGEQSISEISREIEERLGC
jgi:adenylate kinase